VHLKTVLQQTFEQIESREGHYVSGVPPA